MPTNAQRITALEKQVADHEARLAALEGTTPEPPPVPVTGGTYGGWAMRSLDNYRCGWGGITHVSQSFVAASSSPIVSVRCYLQGGSGYGAGNGGTYRVRILPDDGGKPNLSGAGPVVSGVSANGAGSSGNLPGKLVTFPGTVGLVKGQRYHIVWENEAGGNAPDYTSVNSIWNPAAGHRFTDVLQYRQHGAWITPATRVAVHEVTYADGTVQGQPYMELSYPTIPSKVGDVGGQRLVRQTFTSKGMAVIEAGVCAHKQAGSTSPLVVSLRDSSSPRGALLETASVPAAAFPDGAMDGNVLNGARSWGGAAIAATLPAGTYRLELSSTQSRFLLFPLRHGGRAGYGYTNQPWGGGQAQYSIDGGVTWLDFHGRDDDLPAYVEWEA